MKRGLKIAAYVAGGLLLCTVSANALLGMREPPRFAEIDNPSLGDRVFLAISGLVVGIMGVSRGIWELRNVERVRAALGLLKKAERYLEEGSERIPAKYNAVTYALRALRCVKNAVEILEEMEEELESQERELKEKAKEKEKAEKEGEEEKVEKRGSSDVRTAERRDGAGDENSDDRRSRGDGTADRGRREEDRGVSDGGGSEGSG
ncbi:hypothetical protein [Methanopyrus kandleri]|uniref:Uncharacterized protein n=2 Tax=Methanopyrus kandleri TaxID=2320 RepID=Q8TWK4_METKA|nr:hypothetical protein [Methanopyrus kandleri]AAM02242.1 Uncharacterized protein MK1029 [Methanopyrus kandleri AV19]HII69660.1 hypothetical protein [Methanopyrus kandleri]